MFDFSGKYAVVTGGRRGIGAAAAKRFLADGVAGVAVIATSDEIPWLGDLGRDGERVAAFGCDVAKPSEVEATFDAIFESFGRVDYLVNNAGVTQDSMFHKMSGDAWERVIDVDLNGVFYCTKQVLGKMREQGFGRIVMMSSLSFYGNIGQANYAAAKGALISLTKSLAFESARKGITVNAILPAAIETDMLTGLKASDPDAASRMRLGQPEDVASLIAYLCSDEAWFINGATIDINGGIH
ncbi:MAG: SDR family oxidoreductase [Clostridiales Family XIII bacterium]|jgi:3-oxoacyl-[acyl-carrier protein] reductase|nr:SDR family oxidoreductase [Clostridiales Family XIII bacterium]